MKFVSHAFVTALLMLVLFLPQTVSAQEPLTEAETTTEAETQTTTVPSTEAVCEHSFSEYIYDNNATCFSDGTKTAECNKGCGETRTVTAKGTKIVLTKPATLTAKQNTSQIKISWSPVKGATGYDIYYKTADKWKKYAKSASGTSYTFSNLKPSFRVTFAVRAYAEKAGKRITAASYSTVYTATKNTAPAKVASAQPSSQLKLSWTACNGADGYRIYYLKNGVWKVATSFVKGTSVTYKNLPAGRTYTLAVRPVIITDSAVFGEYTTHVTSTKTAAPQAKVSLVSKGKVTLSWNSVSGAEGYQLYYNINDSAYKLYKNYTKPQKLSFNLKGERYYTFAVRAYKKAGGKYIFGDYEPVGAYIGKDSDRVVINPKAGAWNLVLVNKQRELPKDFSLKLGSIPDGYQMDYRAAAYYNKMYQAAAKEGIYLTPVSAYRSRSFQQEIFDETIEDYMYEYDMTRKQAEKKTATEVLYPGTSEHNLGLAVDIGSVSGYFEDSAGYRWLQKNAHKYGFIERYTAGKQKITGIIPEPWHWRFVGVEHATKIKQSGLCLEEYLAKYKLIP